MEYQERIICGKCKSSYYRDPEIIEAGGHHFELDQPLKILVIKKFECTKCQETKTFNIDLVKKCKSKNII